MDRYTAYNEKKLQILKDMVPNGAIYIISTSNTNYIKPVREELINEIMKDISNIDVNDQFYKMMSPANIRRWLFRYMLKREIPLQNILKIMNMPSNNISDEELWEYTTKEFNNEDKSYAYILTDFMNEIDNFR